YVAVHMSLSGPSRHISMSAVWSLMGGLCCKTIFRIRARKIDSRSRVNAQHRFKNSFAPIRLLRISIPQLLRGDFCNTIGGKAEVLITFANDVIDPSATSAVDSDIGTLWNVSDRRIRVHSALMSANLTTLAHLSTSSASTFP